MPTIRRLAANLAADVAGYSRLMGVDEEGTHERLKAHLAELINPKIAERRGRIVKNTGDGFLAEFASVVDAVRCAAEVQRGMAERNADAPAEERIEFRIGINLGDVIVEEHDIFGDGVNVAARLEALAEPGGICVSRVVRDQVRDRLDCAFEDLGEQSVKNIVRPVRVYALRPEDIAGSSRANVASTASSSSPVFRPRLSIVVLPFVNLGGDREQQYFADAITEDLTTDLSRISDSFVIARNTAFTYKGKPVDVTQIGRELGVRYVLEGSIRRMGEQVRVNVQLIDAETGAHLWAERFDAQRANLSEAQDKITGRLARTLTLELIEHEACRIERKAAMDPDACDLAILGWCWFYHMHSAVSRQKTLHMFEQTLAIDPRNVDAKIGIATVLVANVGDAWSHAAEQDKIRAEQLLLEAVEADANNPGVHFALGHLRRLQNRLAESKIELERAISLDPNHARAHHHLGMTIMYLGQPEAAIPHLEKALQLNPNDYNIGNYYFPLALCLLFLGQIDKAIDLLMKARAANPRLYYLHLHLAGAFGLHGDLSEAKAALAEGIRLKPEIRSLAEWRALFPWGDPEYWTFMDRTVATGLRRAGLPDQ